jgi:hypothetical protein
MVIFEFGLKKQSLTAIPGHIGANHKPEIKV